MVTPFHEFNPRWHERWIARRRLLFYSMGTSNTVQAPVVPAGFRLESRMAVEIAERPDWRHRIPQALQAAGGDNLTLETYLIFEETDANPVGAASLLMVHHGNVWYDNVPLLAGEARLVGLAVDAAYRGLGLGRFLQRQWYFSAQAHHKAKLISAIVERHRTPSIRAQQGVFAHVTHNWLLKVAGRNVFSVVTGGEHKGIAYVGPGRSCRWRNDE